MTTKTYSKKFRQLTCDRCANVWEIPAEKQLPKVCGKCKSYLWNESEKPRKQPKGETK